MEHIIYSFPLKCGFKAELKLPRDVNKFDYEDAERLSAYIKTLVTTKESDK